MSRNGECHRVILYTSLSLTDLKALHFKCDVSFKTRRELPDTQKRFQKDKEFLSRMNNELLLFEKTKIKTTKQNF